MRNDAHLSARLLEAVARQVHSTRTLADLSPGQWAILRCLDQFGQRGRTFDHVATYVNEDRATLGRALASLQRKSLVESIVAGENVVAFKLSAGGKQKLLSDPVNLLASALALLSATERAALNPLLEGVLSAIVQIRTKRS